MRRKFEICLLISWICGAGLAAEDKCLSGGGGAGRYSKELNEKWRVILDKISEAEGAYSGKEKEELGDNRVCSLYEDLIDKDLSAFRAGIKKDMIEKVRERGSLYQIIDGKLYREKSCKFPARCKGIEHSLRKIAGDLPNMELVINTSDWPQIYSYFPDKLPLFSFSKTSEYADITYPAWTFWEGGPSIPIYPGGIGRWDKMRKTLMAAAKKYSWDKKHGKGFFRGSRTSDERDALILLSREQPELIDAQYTKNQAWKSDKDTLNAPAAAEVSFEDHCMYKYLFNYRGVAASFRFKHLFLCKSLVYHVGDEWLEFFYPAMKPWVHYIPVRSYASKQEIRSLLEFAKENDGVAQAIAERGYNFIKKHLKLEHVTCYWKSLLVKYATLLKYDVRRRDDVSMIP